MKKIKNALKKKTLKQQKRSNRVRTKLVATTSRLRLAVYRSNNYIYAQIIDDLKGHTLVSSSDIKITEGTKTEKAQKVGQDLAEKAQKAGISEVAFDRNGYKYTGRVQSLADGARQAGLKF